MTATTSEVEFRPLIVPASIDAPDAADFIELSRVRNLVYREISGHDDDALTPQELLPHYLPDPDELRLVWTVWRGGELIGRIGVDVPQQPGSHTAFWLIELLRAHHGLGIGSRAYELVERTAREHGRTVLQTWAEQPESPESGAPRLASPTGFGSVPLDHSARFLQRHGYALAQVARISALDLRGTFDRIQQLRTDALAHATGYRIVQWRPPTPAAYAEAYGWMKSRMITDTPSAALEFDEEDWDAAKVARHDDLYLKAGRTMLVTAAQHVASGELCAFNELVIGSDPSAASHQEDTLVLEEHRGHRLGMLVKTEGLLRWRELAPRSRRSPTRARGRRCSHERRRDVHPAAGAA